MRIEAELLKALRVPFAVAAVLLGASALLAADAWSRIHQAEAAEQAREAAAAEVQRGANTLRGERDNAIAFGPRFVDLEASGAFETLSRPLVIDRFDAATESWRTQVKRYTLGVPGDALLPGVPELSMHKVRQVTLNFDMQPKHEGSFIEIANAVVRAMPGLRALDRCEIGWTSEDSDDTLKASCNMTFYAFERRSDSSGGAVFDGGGAMKPGGMR